MTDTTPTTHKPQSDMISRPMARLLVGFIAIVLLLVGYASFTGRHPSAVVSDGKIVQEYRFIMEAEPSGAVRLYDLDNALVASLSPKEGGFISSIHRTIKRKRTLSKAPQGGPVVLSVDDLGQIKISDPSSGWSAHLMAFGRDNARAFATLLDQNLKGN